MNTILFPKNSCTISGNWYPGFLVVVELLCSGPRTMDGQKMVADPRATIDKGEWFHIKAHPSVTTKLRVTAFEGKFDKNHV